MTIELLSRIAFFVVLIFASVRSIQAIRWNRTRELARFSVINSPSQWRRGVRNAVRARLFGVAVILGSQSVWLTYFWIAVGSFLIFLGLFWVVICVKVLKERQTNTPPADDQVINRRTEYRRRAGVVFAICTLGWLMCGVVTIT